MVNVPDLAEKRQNLLPLARKFAELPADVKAKCVCAIVVYASYKIIVEVYALKSGGIVRLYSRWPCIPALSLTIQAFSNFCRS